MPSLDRDEHLKPRPVKPMRDSEHIEGPNTPRQIDEQAIPIHAEHVNVHVTLPYRRWWEREVAMPAWTLGLWLLGVCFGFVLKVLQLAERAQ